MKDVGVLYMRQFNGHLFRCVKDENDMVWVAAADLASALGYDYTTSMLKLLKYSGDRTFAKICKMQTNGGPQDLVILNTFLVQECISRTRHKEGKEFRRNLHKFMSEVIKYGSVPTENMGTVYLNDIMI